MEDQFDVLVRNARIVRPNSEPQVGDIAIKDGSFAAVGGDIAGTATETIDGTGLLAFPGIVDAHQHWGIYNPLEEDTRTESRAAAQGGVTTGITYIRTGSTTSREVAHTATSCRRSFPDPKAVRMWTTPSMLH